MDVRQQHSSLFSSTTLSSGGMLANWPLLSDIPPETFVVTVKEKF